MKFTNRKGNESTISMGTVNKCPHCGANIFICVEENVSIWFTTDTLYHEHFLKCFACTREGWYNINGFGNFKYDNIEMMKHHMR